jgi:hypothetical protein
MRASRGSGPLKLNWNALYWKPRNSSPTQARNPVRVVS